MATQFGSVQSAQTKVQISKNCIVPHVACIVECSRSAVVCILLWLGSGTVFRRILTATDIFPSQRDITTFHQPIWRIMVRSSSELYQRDITTFRQPIWRIMVRSSSELYQHQGYVERDVAFSRALSSSTISLFVITISSLFMCSCKL